MKNHALYLLLAFAWIGCARAEPSLETARIDVCERLLQCKSYRIGEVPSSTRREVDALAAKIPPGASRAVVQAHFGYAPLEAIESRSLFDKKQRVAMVTWFTTDRRRDKMDPHVDVTFIDDRAAAIRYMASLTNSLQIWYAE